MSADNKDKNMQQELDEAIEELREEKPRSAQKGASKPNLELIMGIPVDVQVVLGGTTMPVANLMKLGRGAVITLDKQIKAVNYSIETVNGTVYVMGIAQSQAEVDRIRNHARQLSYVRRVVNYVRIKDAKSGAG